MTHVPLLGHRSVDALFAYTPRGPVDVRTFLAEAGELAARLPAGGYFLNLCRDRYRFALGLAAGLLTGRVSLQPSSQSAETLRQIQRPGFFEDLSRKTSRLVDGLKAAAAAQGVPFSADCQGGMFGFFLFQYLPQNYATVMSTDSKRFNTLFHGLLERGVYIAPALYEAGFVSAAHTDQDIEQTISIAAEVFRLL